jgi:hypothetical protein
LCIYTPAATLITCKHQTAYGEYYITYFVLYMNTKKILFLIYTMPSSQNRGITSSGEFLTMILAKTQVNSIKIIELETVHNTSILAANSTTSATGIGTENPLAKLHIKNIASVIGQGVVSVIVGADELQIDTVTFRADVAGDLNHKYWLLRSAQNAQTFGVWYNVNSAGINQYTGDSIEVAVATGATAADVALATGAAIVLAYPALFSIPAPGADIITITHTNPGFVTIPTDVDVGGVWATAQTTLGVGNTDMIGTVSSFNTQLGKCSALRIGSESFTIARVISATRLVLTTAPVASLSSVKYLLDLVSFQVDTSNGKPLFTITNSGVLQVPAGYEDLVTADSHIANKAYVDSVAGIGTFNGPSVATHNAIVRFNGTGGNLVQDSSVVVDNVGNLGIGTITPLLPLHVVGTLSGWTHSNDASGSGVSCVKTRGTEAVPTAILDDDNIARFAGTGYDGTTLGGGGSFNTHAAENWAVGAHGSYARISTIGIGTTTENVLTVGPTAYLNVNFTAADQAPIAPVTTFGDATYGNQWNWYSADNSDGPSESFIKTRGTFNSPTAVIASDSLGTVRFEGQDDVATGIGASIGVRADTAWLTTDHECSMYFATANSGSPNATDKMTLSSDGDLRLNTYGAGNLRTDSLGNVRRAGGLFNPISPIVSSNWISQVSAADISWRAISWSPELHIFCAVGQDDVMTSPDGVTWTLRVTGFTVSWRGITWSPELSIFCAVGVGGSIMISPDGITWTLYAAVTSGAWPSVTWSPELGIFCAVSSNFGAKLMTSPDGITWTQHEPPSVRYWNSIVWSSELRIFFAVANDSATTEMMTSPDGITWTYYTTADDGGWRSVAWSPELSLFAIVANGGATRVMTSPDAINWTARAVPEANEWFSITWGAEVGMFVAVANSGTNRVMTSIDGITWVARHHPNGLYWQSVTWSPQLRMFCAVSNNGTGNRVMTSSASDLTVTQLTISEPETPLTSSSAGTQGMFRWSATHIYICIATNTWRRIIHTTW